MDDVDRTCVTVFDHPSCYATDPAGEMIIFGPPGQPPSSFTFQQKCDAHCASVEFNATIPIIACAANGPVAREEDCLARVKYEASCGPARSVLPLPKRSCTNVDTTRDPRFPITLIEADSHAVLSFHSSDGGTDSVTVAVTGKLSMDRDRCALGNCPVSLLPISLHLRDFEVGGERFRDVAVGLARPLPGTLDSSGVLVIPQNGATVSVRGTLENDGVPRQEDFPMLAPLVGRVDHSTGRVTLSFVASSTAFRSSLEFTLVGQLKERSPIAAFTLAPIVECNSAGGSLVEVDARQSIQLDGTGLEFRWSIDGFPAGAGAQTQLFIPLGQHQVQLYVRTPGSLNNVLAMPVTVVDTVPPRFDEVGVEPACIWPPNHSMAIFRLGNEISVKASDVCDPALRIEILGVEDSQANETRGAGQTSPDVRWSAEAACVRQERSGVIKVSREYAIRVAANSTTGPSGTAAVIVQVPHDQRGGGCRPARPIVEVADDDARCAVQPSVVSGAPDAPAPDALLPERSGALSCSTSPGGCATVLLLAAYLMVWTRRPSARRERRKHPWRLLPAVALVAGCAELPMGQGQLGECAKGWWLGPSASCTVLCPGQAECDAGDCERRSFMALLPDAVALQGFISQSKSARTFSSFGTVDQSRWAADEDGGRLRLTTSGMWVGSVCSEQALTYSIADVSRAPPDLAAALNSAPRDGGWRALSY